MKKAIVTGAGGFIGGALTELLLQKGTTVYGVDISERALERHAGQNFIPVIADFSKYHELHSMISDRDIDVFYHFAWQGGFEKSIGDYRLQLENAKACGGAITAAMSVGCRKFVNAGTYNQYEITSILNSNADNLRPTCIYSAAKTAANIICKTIASHNIEYCAGLIPMPYGEYNRSMQLPNVLMLSLLRGVSPKLVEGNNWYDMVYIADIAAAFEAIGERGKSGCEYYIGHRDKRTFKDIVTEIGNIIAPDVDLKFGEYVETKVFDESIIDFDKLYVDTGYECRTDFKESIMKTAQWLRSEYSAKTGGGGYNRQVSLFASGKAAA